MDQVHGHNGMGTEGAGGAHRDGGGEPAVHEPDLVPAHGFEHSGDGAAGSDGGHQVTIPQPDLPAGDEFDRYGEKFRVQFVQVDRSGQGA